MSAVKVYRQAEIEIPEDGLTLGLLTDLVAEARMQGATDEAWLSVAEPDTGNDRPSLVVWWQEPAHEVQVITV